MRSSTLLASGAVLLFGPLGSAAAESSSLLHMPRDGPLPISQLYLKPIKGKSTYYGHYLGGGSCGLDQLDGSAIPKEVRRSTYVMEERSFVCTRVHACASSTCKRISLGRPECTRTDVYSCG